MRPPVPPPRQIAARFRPEQWRHRCWSRQTKVGQASNKKVREAYKRALDVMKSRQWLRLELNTNKNIIERQILGHFDESASFQPMKTRILEEHMRTQWVLLHEGMICSEGNDVTMTRVVLDTSRAHPTVVDCHQVRSLSEETLKDVLMEEVNAIQKQNMVVSKFLDAHNNPRWLLNNTQCFFTFSDGST